MHTEWISSINAQIEYLLKQEPSQQNAIVLASLYHLQDKLPFIANDETAGDVLTSMIDRLRCDVHTFKSVKQHSLLNGRESHTNELDSVLTDLTSLLDIIRQSGDSVERELLDGWIKSLQNNKIN